MVINKKLIRSSGAVKTRLVSSAVIIALSVALMISFSTAMKSVRTILDNFRNDNVLHDIRVCTVKPIEESNLKQGDIFEKRIYTEAELSAGKILRIAAVTEKIDIPYVTAGSGISKSDEMLLDSMFAQKNNILIGDSMDIMGRGFTVCGFYTSPDTVLPAKTAESIMVSSDSYGLAAMSAADIESLGRYETEYLIKLENSDNDSINAAVEALHTDCIVTECKKSSEDNRATYIDGDIKLFSEDFLILPEIFILIAALSCSAVISRIMKSESTQIGVMYAVGYKRRTLYAHYMLYPFAVWLLSVMLGVASGLAFAPSIAGILKSRYLLPSYEMQLFINDMAKSAALPFSFMAVICSLTVLFMLARTPLELIKDEKASSKLSLMSHIKLKGMPFSARFTIRSLIRNLPRELFLVMGIAFSSLLMLTYVSMISSLSGVLDESFNEILRYKYMYTFSIPQTAPHNDVCMINSLPVLLEGDHINISGTYDNLSFMNYTNEDGSKTDFNENVITNNMAKKYGIHEGDTVSVTNSLSDEVYEIKIDKVCVSYVENFISVPLERFNEMTHQPQGAYVILASASELDIKDKSALTTVDTIEANRRAVSQTIRPLNTLLAILIVAAATAALMIIVIITSVIIEESRHTISLMKAFGYADRRISRLVIDSNAIAAVLGYLVSIPLVLKLSGYVFAFMSDTLGMYIPAKLQTGYCIAGFVFVMAIFFLAKLITQRKILSANASEALKARE